MNNKFNPTVMADYLYSKLPQVYRDEDRELLLKRFIEVFSEGGFTPLLTSTTNIMDLLDVDKCPTKFLPLLCSLYGYEYSLEIPELFQRRLLKLIVEMYKRKGTKSAIKFIARELTGFDSEIIENKDFNADQIEVSGWDKGFHNYRNFILRLTAPYENSILYDREDIVIKIIDGFLPTNSKVLVITAYWFREDSQIVKNTLNSIYDVVTEYNTEIFENVINDSLPYDVIKENPFTFEGQWMAEEESYLNFPLEGMLLTTNVVANIKDIVTFNLESYNVVVNPEEVDSLNKTTLKEPDEAVVQDKPYTDTYRTSQTPLIEEYKDICDFNISEKTTLAVEDELNTTDKNGSIIYLTMKIIEVLDDLSNIISGAQESICDIMNMVDNVNSNFAEQINTNVLLNRENGLYTNALTMWDIVKEPNKPDKYILI